MLWIDNDHSKGLYHLYLYVMTKLDCMQIYSQNFSAVVIEKIGNH